MKSIQSKTVIFIEQCVSVCVCVSVYDVLFKQYLFKQYY